MKEDTNIKGGEKLEDDMFADAFLSQNVRVFKEMIKVIGPEFEKRGPLIGIKMDTIRKVFRFPAKTHDENLVKTIKNSKNYYNDYISNGGSRYDVGMKRHSSEDRNVFWIRMLESDKTIEERMASIKDGIVDVSFSSEDGRDKSKIHLEDFSPDEQKDILDDDKK